MKNTWAVPFFAIILITSTFAFPPYYQIENQAFALDPNDGIVTTVLSPSKDSFITQGSAKDNEGANPNLRIISSDKNRPVIAFDQTEIVAATEGLVFLSATLRLNVVDNGNNWGPDGRLIGTHQILQDWAEGNGFNVGNNISGTGDGTTWNCPIDTDISNNQDDCGVQWGGGNFESLPLSTILITNDVLNQFIEFDVTSDVQSFLDDTETNFGWLVKKDDESKNGTIKFASKENLANQPELVIVAQDPAVLLALEYLELTGKLNDVGVTLDAVTITQQLLDDINSDLTRLKEIVIELQNLGFDGQATAARLGTQMVGTVSFSDSQTTELFFETQIPDGALGILAVIGLNDEFSAEGIVYTFDQLVALLSSSQTIVEVITNFEDDEIASNFVLASIAAFHPSTGNTFQVQFVGAGAIVVVVAINACLLNPICEAALLTLLGELAKTAIEFSYPLVTVTGIKFDDKNANGIRDDPVEEPGLFDWRFTMNPTLDFGTFVESFSDENGVFAFIEKRVPRPTTTIFITETLQDGWEVTTPLGEVHEIPFVPLDPPLPFQDPPVVVLPVQLFGNHLLVPPTPEPIFFEDFAGIAGWTLTSCILNNPPGQTCNIGLTSALIPVPSLPNWGFVETFDFVPGCQNLGPNVEARFSHPFTVTTNGTFTLSSWVGTSPCTTCDIFSQLLVDGDAKISVKGRNLLFDPPQNRTTFQQATFDMTQGEHQITMRSFTPGGMCFGNFRTFFDDITIVGSTSPLTGPMTGGPYFYPEINQTSINATKPTVVTIPLKVEWFDGYYAELVNVELYVINGTDIGISSTVTSIENATMYKLFDLTFDISDAAQVGEEVVGVLVTEVNSGDFEWETITINVE